LWDCLDGFRRRESAAEDFTTDGPGIFNPEHFLRIPYRKTTSRICRDLERSIRTKKGALGASKTPLRAAFHYCLHTTMILPLGATAYAHIIFSMRGDTMTSVPFSAPFRTFFAVTAKAIAAFKVSNRAAIVDNAIDNAADKRTHCPHVAYEGAS
jgi:hypothetical protein